MAWKTSYGANYFVARAKRLELKLPLGSFFYLITQSEGRETHA